MLSATFVALSFRSGPTAVVLLLTWVPFLSNFEEANRGSGWWGLRRGGSRSHSFASTWLREACQATDAFLQHCRL